jgi:hypothetical protein
VLTGRADVGVVLDYSALRTFAVKRDVVRWEKVQHILQESWVGLRVVVAARTSNGKIGS